jgi:hypothetical protein
MSDDIGTRRDFLTRFAMLSSAALLLGLGGCGRSNTNDPPKDPPPGAVYGPPPATDVPYVGQIYFVAPGPPFRITLNGDVYQDVPVNAAFSFLFTDDMDTSVLPTVIFLDENDAVVPITKTWTDIRTLSVVPSSDLLHDTIYTLGMGIDAIDTRGNTLVLDSNAMVMFRTAL